MSRSNMTQMFTLVTALRLARLEYALCIGLINDFILQERCPRLSDGTTITVGATRIWDELQKANTHHRQVS